MNSSIIKPEIVYENEKVARNAFEKGNYILCFLLIHSLIESLLRTFLEKTGKETFSDLIKSFSEYMKTEGQIDIPFVNELTELNRRRNRFVHQLWEKGYSEINENLIKTCQSALIVFGLLIEWLETFNPEITISGFEYE